MSPVRLVLASDPKLRERIATLERLVGDQDLLITRLKRENAWLRARRAEQATAHRRRAELLEAALKANPSTNSTVRERARRRA